MTTATDHGVWRPHDTLPNRLRLLRAELDITQKEGAMRIGITPRVWQGMEEGRAVRDLHKHINAISLAYNVDRDWLMWGGPLNDETPPPNPGEGSDGGEECAIRDSNPEPADIELPQVTPLFDDQEWQVAS